MVLIGLFVWVGHEEVAVLAGLLGSDVLVLVGISGFEVEDHLEILGHKLRQGIIEALNIHIHIEGMEVQFGRDVRRLRHILDLPQVVLQQLLEDIPHNFMPCTASTHIVQSNFDLPLGQLKSMVLFEEQVNVLVALEFGGLLCFGQGQ